MNFIIRLIFVCILLVSSVSSIGVMADDINAINATRIEFNDKALARKVAISFHHAILETNYEDGYIIADLSESEIASLKAQDLKLSTATEWNKKYQQFQEDIKLEVLRHGKTKMAGIPGFECYATVEETYEQALAFVSDYPNLAEWIDIGDSWKKENGEAGYDLMVLKITNQNITADKPKLFINTGLHAREYAPVALATDFAHKLLAEYETNADIQWIVDHHEVHLLLQTNPDGRKIAEAGIYQRKNMNANHCPTGNNNNGEWLGVDLNRNFAQSWNITANGSSGDSCSQVFRGGSAESEPETKALSNYVRSLFPDARGPDEQDAAPLTTSGIHLDIHSYSQLVLWPYGHTNNPSPNNAGFVALGNKFAWFNDYSPQQSIGLYATDGTSDAVSYGELGVAAFTFELGSEFFQQCSVYENRIKPDNLNALVYAAKAVPAPYLLAFGPEITAVELNGSLGSVTVEPGANIEISVTATAIQTKLNHTGRTVSKIEYSVDTPIWQDDAAVFELTQNDGALTSGIETLQGSINTSGLSIGQHKIFIRAYDGEDKVGVVTARFIQLTETLNSLPVAEISYQCNDLQCEFNGAESSDPDGSIVSYEWNFNHEAQADGVSASHTFTGEGDKEVSLIITDNLAAKVSKSINVTVTAAEPEPEPDSNTASSSGGGSALWLQGFWLLLWGKRKRG